MVHIVDEQNIKKINKTAASLPPDESEIEIANLTPVESVKISVPGVNEAKIRMECSSEHSLELGNSDTPGCDLIIGKVDQFYIESDIFENGRINPRG